jgi:drug/metabolite transporter (DMT)-like permease
MTRTRRIVASLCLFVGGAGLMVAFDAPGTLAGGLLMQLAAVGFGASTILTHDLLSAADDSGERHP